MLKTAGRQRAVQALGFALLETILGALTEGSREKTQQEALQRLVGTVFRRDMAAFRYG